MKFGYKLPNCAGVLCEPEWSSAENIENLCRFTRNLGFSSVWMHDHLLPPDEVTVAEPKIHEPLISISYLASKIPDLTFGVSALVLPLRDPVLLASQLTTLNEFLPQRVILCVGVGRYETEFRAAGSNYFHQRGAVSNEVLYVLRSLWSEDEFTHDGNFFRVNKARHYPKVYRDEMIPIWVGGNVKASIKRAVRYGDGYMPAAKTPVEMREAKKVLERELQVNNRDPLAFPLGLSLTIDLRHKGEGEADGLEERGMHGHERDRILSGNAQKIIDGLNLFSEAGVDHIALSFRAKYFEQLKDRIELFSSSVMPAVS